ncbi:hypothetical protein EIP91_008002 [Steccherinum ochraceum]|uniref:Uncharacterized protein n=1 Tax=Steccherinum ochraceum TaxID=92696 RepID=A0A4R0R972_9APHY|nr:hypothetical protein EIP91_008002 [Steccherinum ochraceum]
MVPSLAELDIIAAALQSMLYGAALLMFMLTMYILLQDHRRRRLNRTMIGASFAMIFLATVELGVNIQWIKNGFITLGPKHIDGVEGYFADVSEPAYIVKTSLYNVQTLIFDAAVIYRAYIVWQKWYVILIPGVLWCCLLASVVGINHALATSPQNTDNIFAITTGGWITAVYALTLATNVTATGLLAYRIWRVSRRAAEFVPSDRLSVVLHVVLESGTIYSMITIAALITFLAGSPVVYLLLDLISPIISIVFNMIIVRVGLSSSRTALPALGIESAGVTSDLEFATSDAGRLPTFRTPQGENGVELKSMTVDLDDCGDADGTSVIDTKHGTLGTSSSESNPRKSRVSL